LDILSTGHFIWGKANETIDEPDLTHLNAGPLNCWQKLCQMQQAFWRKWSTFYLSLLQEHEKWQGTRQNLHPKTMVGRKKDHAPPLKWPLGTVSSVITGEDGIARVVVIRNAKGLVRRAIATIAVLPIETKSVESLNFPTVGEC